MQPDPSLALASMRHDLIGSKRPLLQIKNPAKTPSSIFKGVCLTSVFPQEEATKADGADSWPGTTNKDTRENIAPRGCIVAGGCASFAGMASESFLFERRE